MTEKKDTTFHFSTGKHKIQRIITTQEPDYFLWRTKAFTLSEIEISILTIFQSTKYVTFNEIEALENLTQFISSLISHTFFLLY